MRHYWRMIGIEFHWRYREGGTWLDLRRNHYLSHWGFYSIEYERKRRTFWRWLRLSIRSCVSGVGDTP